VSAEGGVDKAALEHRAKVSAEGGVDKAAAETGRHHLAVDAQSSGPQAVSEITTETVEELLCELVLVLGDTTQTFDELVSRLRPPELRKNLCNGRPPRAESVAVGASDRHRLPTSTPYRRSETWP
jgi:hypothetical protein